MHSQEARGSCYENTGHIAPGLRQPEKSENRVVKHLNRPRWLTCRSQDPLLHVTPAVKPLLFEYFVIPNGMKRKETVLYSNIKWTLFIWPHWNSLHNRRLMSQARRTRHFARSAKRAWSARGGEEKKLRVRQVAHKAHVMQANTAMDSNQSQFLSLII